MKKLFLTLAAVTAVSASSFAQEKGWYIKPAISYFAKVTPVEFPNVGPLQPRETVYAINPSTGASSVTSEKSITGSFGSGYRAGLTIGKTFNSVVSAELAINYFNSNEQTMAKQQGFVAGTEMQLLHLQSKGKVHAVDIAPTFVMNFPTSGKVQPYAKVGVIIPVYGFLQIDTEASDKTGMVASTVNSNFRQVELTRSEKIKPNPTFGFTSGLGLNIPISGKLSLTTELEYRNISIGGKEKEITAFDAVGTLANGVTVPVGINDLPTVTKEVKYVTELTANSNVAGHAGFDANKPGEDLKSYINIGGLGLSVGLKIKL